MWCRYGDLLRQLTASAFSRADWQMSASPGAQIELGGTPGVWGTDSGDAFDAGVQGRQIGQGFGLCGRGAARMGRVIAGQAISAVGRKRAAACAIFCSHSGVGGDQAKAPFAPVFSAVAARRVKLAQGAALLRPRLAASANRMKTGDLARARPCDPLDHPKQRRLPISLVGQRWFTGATRQAAARARARRSRRPGRGPRRSRSANASPPGC